MPPKRVEQSLASYVDPQVVRHILSGGSEPLLSGVRRVVTCLFADVRGFTRFAAAANPARVVGLLDRFFASACEIAVRHGGSIDKLMGDAVMVLFGVPARRRHDARRAVAAGLAMIEAFENVGPGTPRRARRPGLGLGVGVATGPVILANVGSATRMDYTVVGATVNLAARLCAEARAGEVLYDPATGAALAAGRAPALVATVRPLRLKGIPGTVHAVSVRARGAAAATPFAAPQVDPVCGMKIPPRSPHVVRHAGQTFRFCSRGCRSRFARDPASFRAAAR